MLIAMAGLPGTGKSTLARALAADIGAVVLDKDRVRAALFPPGVLDYSAAQNDFAMEVIYETAAFLLAQAPDRPVIVDGRTFSQRAQVECLVTAAAQMEVPLRIIECICSEETAKRRLTADVAEGLHPAADRDFALYRRLKARFDPLPEERLVVDTDLSLEKCLCRLRTHIQHP